MFASSTLGSSSSLIFTFGLGARFSGNTWVGVALSSSSSMLFSLATSFLGVEGGDAFRQHQAQNQGCRLHRLEADLVGLLPSVQSQHGF